MLECAIYRVNQRPVLVHLRSSSEACPYVSHAACLAHYVTEGAPLRRCPPTLLSDAKKTRRESIGRGPKDRR